MIKLILTATILLISGIAFADVPNTFEAGSAIKASEMNENFTSIDNEVSAVAEDTTGHATSISDLESEVAMLKGQLESLQSSSGSPVVFQGFSVGLVDGSEGYIALQNVCSLTFPDSKVCTTSEFINSIHNPNAANLSGDAHILPSLSGGRDQYGLLVEGLGGLPNDRVQGNLFACDGFRSNQATSSTIAVTSAGGIFRHDGGCQTPMAVACCK